MGTMNNTTPRRRAQSKKEIAVKKEFVKGALVMIVNAETASMKKFLGHVHTLGESRPTESGLMCWGFEPELIDPADGYRCWFWEGHLKVLKDGPGDDEMLTRVGKPNRQTFIDEAMKNGPASKRPTEAEFEVAQDRWIQGVDA